MSVNQIAVYHTLLKAIGRAKAGRGEEPVAKFRKFEKTENTFTLKIRET